MSALGYSPPLVGELLLRTLRDLGVRHVFSLPGAQILPLWDAFHHVAGIELVVPHSETSGAFMAEGYGRVAPVPAVVMNTVGVGVANEIPGSASALRSGTPVLYVSPRQPGPGLPGSFPQPRLDKRARRGSVFQGLAHPSLLDLHAKEAFAVESQEELWCRLPDALAAALAPPAGPVRVHVPYPLLYDPARPQPAPMPEERVAPPASGILALEEKGDGGPWKDDLFRLPPPQPIWPGIGRSGYGMPFALGARLARPGVPTVLVTSPGAFLASLECAGLAARSLRLEVHVVQMDVKAGAELRRAAALVGAAHHLAPGKADLRQLVQGHPDAWVVICR